MLSSKEAIQASYDLVVIGGGINGAAVARDAALRGLKVILLEKTDFGAGASTKTSKLAHGGLRYLEQYEFGLVKESLYERNLLLKNASHLVSPLKFTFPVYTHSARPLWQVNLGLYLYDFFSRDSELPNHCKLDTEQVVNNFPGIQSKGLVGGCCYYDAQMKDNRLVIENVLAAEMAGATILNYAKVIKLLWNQRKIEGVIFRYDKSGNEINIKSELVVNATGAWSNEITDLESGVEHARVAPTKGVHLVVPKMFPTGLILRAPQDGRIFFVLPWEGYSLIGATDTFFNDPEATEVDKADVTYLLEAFHHHFPHFNIGAEAIISTFVGLRPLVANHHSKKPSLISRDHAIQFSKGGLITVLGGKFTTHRKMAEEVVDRIISHMDPLRVFKHCRTHELPLPGAIISDYNLEKELEEVGLQKIQVDHLMQNYGQLAKKILEIIKINPLEMQPICSEHPHILAELTYAIKFEHVKRMDDWLYRRTSIAYGSCQGKNNLEAVVEKFLPLSR
ncbi:MAG: glycerol-3-phosphate dehydrogenase [Parachlamydiaceae bacterium]|nr:glycerol-3-phosphate dehydrogenase [Parachlamydiaceae bacterium]